MMDDLGGMVRGGYIDIRIIAYTTMGPIISTWEKLEHIIEGWREYANSPRICNGNEYLYEQVVEFRKKYPNV